MWSNIKYRGTTVYIFGVDFYHIDIKEEVQEEEEAISIETKFNFRCAWVINIYINSMTSQN